MISYISDNSNYQKSVKWFQVLLCITNNSIKHQLFVYIQLNDQTVASIRTQFSKSHFSLVEYETVLFDP